jgi:hypothetical protein
MTMYFGYKLFMFLPMQNDNAGKIQLPGLKVVLSKVGPGIFFVAFATVLLAKALSPVKIEPGSFLGGVALGPLPSAVAKPDQKPSATEHQLERARHTLQTLNCVERTVIASKAGLREDELEESMRDAKIALIESVWNETLWGDRTAFRKWAQTKTRPIPTQLRELYESKMTDCPR